MADLNSTSPDIYHQVNNNETPSHYERRLDSFPDVSEKTGKVIIDTKKNVATILVSSETKKETEALSEDFKQEFIEKLKKLPDFEGSKAQEAIEKETIEIKKIPGRDGYAIYESKVGNLIYITKLDGIRHTNIDKYRTYTFLSNAFEGGYIKQGYSKIELNNGLWKLFDKDGIEVPIFSDEYSKATFNAINHMWDIVSEFEEIKNKKEGK